LCPTFVHLGRDHCEIAAVFLQEPHQSVDIPWGPNSRISGCLGDVFLFAVVGVLECDFIDDSGDGGD